MCHKTLNMKYWIYRDGLQRGPYTIEELADMNLQPDTPVWYEGLDNWITAAESPGLAPLLATRRDDGNDRPHDVDFVDLSDNHAAETPDSGARLQQSAVRQPTEQTSQSAAQMPQGKCPPTYLALSIIATICCCLPLGIASIFFSGKVKPKWQLGDEAGARKASETAEILIILSITLSLLSLPLAFLLK